MKKQFLFIAIAFISFGQLKAQTFAAVDVAPEITTEKKEKITRADIADFRNEGKAIVENIQKLQIYPECAMDYGIEGRVVLAIEFDGEIKSVKVVTSGGEVLDNAALEAVKEFEKHYQAEGKQTKKMNIYVPFLFKL